MKNDNFPLCHGLRLETLLQRPRIQGWPQWPDAGSSRLRYSGLGVLWEQSSPEGAKAGLGCDTHRRRRATPVGYWYLPLDVTRGHPGDCSVQNGEGRPFCASCWQSPREEREERVKGYRESNHRECSKFKLKRGRLLEQFLLRKVFFLWFWFWLNININIISHDILFFGWLMILNKVDMAHAISS